MRSVPCQIRPICSFKIEHLVGMEGEQVLHFTILMSNISKTKIMN